MTSPAGCPSCSAPLTGAPQCPSCGLRLTGPSAARLWQVDQQLTTLRQQQTWLQEERTMLLDRLRSDEPEPAPVPPPAPGPVATWTPALDRPRKESSPKSVQNTLLTLGALLLAGAGLVFTAWAYGRLGHAGRALVLLALTGATLGASALLVRRRLTASAEAVGAVGVILCLLDLYALRRAGLGDELEHSTYLAWSFGLLAAALGAYSTSVPLRTTRWATAVLAQLPVPCVLVRTEADLPLAAVVLVVQAAVDLGIAARSPLPRDVKRWLVALAGGLVFVSLVLSFAAVEEDDRSAGAGFIALAALVTAAAWLARDRGLRLAVSLPAVPLLAAAAWAGVRPRLTEDQQPLVVIAVAVLALQLVALLPREHREGHVTGALAVAGAAVAVELQPVLEALFGPLGWLADPWSRTAEASRQALSPDASWSGTVVTLVVLAGAALAVVTAGLVLERLDVALWPAGVLLVLSAVALPLGLATSYEEALALLLLVGAVLAGGGVLLPRRLRAVGIALVASGTAAAVVAAVWSTADQDATLVVLPLAAALCAGLAVLLPGAHTALALLLVGGEVAAVAAAQGLAQAEVGACVVGGAALAVAATFLLRDVRRWEAEAAAALLALTGVGESVDDPDWLALNLALSGLLALAIAVHRDRRLVSALGGLLLSASSWVRLADAGVEAPEPYVAPIALTALVLGWYQRRTHPSLSSMQVYGPGLTVALLPSLLKSFEDDTPTRGLLLLGVCVGLVLVGGYFRLRAPLAIGAGVAAVETLNLLAPYAAALPRWVLLGSAGLLLVVVGATYEARLRDVQALRERYDRLA